MSGPSLEIPRSGKTSDGRLDSWKEIAAYLNRDVTTVQRWEKREGMPVHRHLHDKRGSVYAIVAELDAWLAGRRAQVEANDVESEPQATDGPAGISSHRALYWIAAGVIAFAVLAGVAITRYRNRTGGAAAPQTIRSLAVLPMRNLSGDASQDYLAEGLTEAIIDRLSSIRDLRVTSHTSVMRFKNPQMSIPEISRTLGVDAVVEGSVIREGSRIRVTAQLIRGTTDEHFWSETYDRELRDALTLESELAQSIADKVQVTITGPEHLRLSAVRPVAPEVYESYLKGSYTLNQLHGRAEIEESIAEFDEAIRKDPTFAPAYLGRAESYEDLGTVFAGVPAAQTRPKVVESAEAALRLDPNLAEAHVLLADVYQQQFRWSDAESEYRRGFDLNPNNAVAQQAFAQWLMCQGRTDEALVWIRRARKLDPFAVSGSSEAWILFNAHRYQEAIRETRSDLAVRPDDSNGLLMMGFALIANDQAAQAIAPLEKVVAESHGSPAAMGLLIRAYAHAGRKADAYRVLTQLKQEQRSGYVPAAAFVNAYLGLGDNEQAFVWLEKAYNEQSNILQFLKTHPYFDPIRSDPRFKSLVHRVGLD